MLVINNAHKTFGTKRVLDGVSLSVDHGKIAVLLGGSGVGKSTLLRILNNLETLDSGTITLDEKHIDLRTINQTHLAGMVFQQFNLFEHLTITENITLALEKVANITKKNAQKSAHQLLEKYGLSDKGNCYPAQLSGGQKQRIALARAAALKPKIMCLDEPTSALDPLLTTHVANTITQLAQEDYIVLIATHDTELLKKLDCTIYLMESGTIVQTAPSHDFAAHPEKYTRLKQFVAGEIQ